MKDIANTFQCIDCNIFEVNKIDIKSSSLPKPKKAIFLKIIETLKINLNSVFHDS